MQTLLTDDGSTTIRSDLFGGQLYHSSRGAVGEADHVYVRFAKPSDRILEIGFGSGLNTLLTLQTGLRIDYTTIELYPIEMSIVEQQSFCCPELIAMHAAPWGTPTKITPDFTLTKLNIDISTTTPVGQFDLVYFDAFAPDVVPEQWTEQVFASLHSIIRPGGQLTTYSAKGIVKQALRAAGFSIKRLPGALGKHNMILATRQ